MKPIHESALGDTRTPSRVVMVMVALAMFLAAAIPAGAQGPDPERLANAGWDCFEHLGADHCVPDMSSLLSGEANSAIILTWGGDGTYWGTELLIHEDLYNGQPCPMDAIEGEDAGDYLYVPDLGVPVPYFVCHHFESPVT